MKKTKRIDSNSKIYIGDSYDGFSITINDERFHFDQEDTKEELVDVFKELGFKNIEYEEEY